MDSWKSHNWENSSLIHIKRNLDMAKEFHWQYRNESLPKVAVHMLFIDPFNL